MAKKKRKVKRGLSRAADAFALYLLFEASQGKVGRSPIVQGDKEPVENPISFRDRRALLDSVTKLLAGEPPDADEEEPDGLSLLQERLNDRDSGTAERGDGNPDDAA